MLVRPIHISNGELEVIKYTQTPCTKSQNRTRALIVQRGYKSPEPYSYRNALEEKRVDAADDGEV